MEGTHLMLDLGSGNPKEGEIRPDGYIYQDIEPHPGIDLVCDIRDLESHIKWGQCKRIRASHICEHFPTNYIPTLFSIIYALLEDKGEFEIHVPNFKWHASLLLVEKDEEAVNYAYGSQKDDYDYHKTAFTPTILIKRLQEVKFNILGLSVDSSIHCVAQKV